MWGGRFEDEMSETTWAFTSDPADRRLLAHDITGSIAHARMLGNTGIIDPVDAETLVRGLEKLLDEEFVFDSDDEDVHAAVERRLYEVVGNVAGKLHTGRSRNDQVALDLRLYLRDSADERGSQLRDWAGMLAGLAEETADLAIPSYTHLQQAQVTSLGNHLLAYAWMALRDIGRFSDCRRRLDQSPLGAGASAGSSLPLDRDGVAAMLGMAGPVPNTLDAVGSRDFVAEYVFCCAQAMVHLSRMAEEIVLWASQEFAWITPGDTVSTGSSALPQKRNPDVAELVRGRASTVIGDAVAILSLQKALPLSYNRDLQEDKRLVFHADDTLSRSLTAMTELIRGSAFNLPPPSPATAALPLAERLVSRGVAFREAHHAVGRLVRRLEAEGKSLDAASYGDLESIDARFTAEDLSVLARHHVPPIDEQLAKLRELLG